MSMSCPEGMFISIQFAQFGRQVPSKEMCPPGFQSDDPNTWNSESYAARQVALWEDTNCLATTSLKVSKQTNVTFVKSKTNVSADIVAQSSR